MHIEYYPVSGDAVPVAVQRASGGARGHRTQAAASYVGKREFAASRPLNDCARPESGRGHFLFHAGTSPGTGGVCARISESFCVTGGHGDPQRLCGWLHANIATVSRRPAGVEKPGSTPGSRSIFGRFVVKGYPSRGGRGGDEPACSYNGVAVPSRREAASGENRGSRADLHRAPSAFADSPSSPSFAAAGARRCGPGAGGAQLLPVLP